MAFNGKYVHIDQLLESTMRDYGLDELYKDEAKEWVWEIMGIVGVTSILQDCTAEIVISDHRGLLPSDIYTFDAESGIREIESNRSLLPTTDIFFDQNKQTTTLTQGIIASETYDVTYDQLGDDLVSQVNDSTVTLDIVYAPGYVYETESYVYRIQGNYIFCGIEDTTLQITYKGFPIFPDNTPMIPDDEKYIRMVKSHLAYMAIRRAFYQGKVSREVKEDIERDYLFDIPSARSRMILPSKDEMENIKRMRMRLLPKPSQFDTGFRYLSTSERLRKM